MPVEIIASAFAEASEVVSELAQRDKGKGKERQSAGPETVTLDHNAPMSRQSFDE